jgi:hypothetical protein
MRTAARPKGVVCRAGLVVLLAATTAADAATLTRGPYLQLLTTHSVTVVWNTDVVAECALELRPPGGTPTVLPGTTGSLCAVTADGLTAGRQYQYVPLAGGAPLTEPAVFRVDDPTRPYSFIVFGDSGTGTADQLAVRDRMTAAAPDFLLHTGDMIYSSGAAIDFDPKFFGPYRDLLRRVVLWPSLGNHDVRTASGAPWLEAFLTPANNAAGSERYYSFDAGNAHIVVLDSNASTSPGSNQHTFLDQDLAASDATWKFVAFHHPLYSSGDHGSTVSLRANLLPLLDRHRVDVVFNGHDHNYERTLPLRADVAVAPGEGTVYVVTGGGGQTLREVGTSSFTAHAEAAFHFTRVTVDGGNLALQMVRADGSVGDSLTLTKATATSTTSTTAPTSTTTTTLPPCPLLSHYTEGVPCDGQVLPRRIARRIERARRFAARPPSLSYHRRLERAFSWIERAIDRAEKYERITPACADELSSAAAGCV